LLKNKRVHEGALSHQPRPKPRSDHGSLPVKSTHYVLLYDSVVIHCHLSVQISMPGFGGSVNKNVSYYCTTPMYLLLIYKRQRNGTEREREENSNNCIISAASYVKTLSSIL